MTLTNGTYELIPEPDEGISEAQVNITKDLSEAPNQGSEELISLTSASPMKASPGA
jgi:hypothetical protein